MTKHVSLEHAIRNAVRDQQYKKPMNEDKEWEKDSAAVKASTDKKFVSKMIDKWGERGGAWLNHPAITGADKNKPVNEAKKEEKEDGDSDNWATRYAKGLKQAVIDIGSGAPETVSSLRGAEAAHRGAIHGTTGRDAPVDPSEIGDISRVGVEASRKLGGKYGPAAKKDKDTEVKASVDAYTPQYDKEKENVEKLKQEKPDAYKAGVALGQYAPDFTSIYSLGKWGLSKLKSKPAVEPSAAPKAVEPTSTPAPKAVPEPSAPKAVEAPTPASTAKELVPSEFKSTKAPIPASDNIPGSAKPIAEPVTPKSAPPEPIQPGGKKPPANQNLEPEVKGTGTEGLAPNPKAAEPPRPQKPYDTGVKTTKEAPPTPANVNKPDVVPQGTPSPGGATPLPGVKITNRPVGPKPANVPEPATAPVPAKMPVAAPRPAPVRVPEPATAPVPKIRPQPIRPGAGPKPPPRPPRPIPRPPRRLLPIPLPSLGRSDYKAPAGSNEYHDVPVKTSVSQARGHRKFGSTSVSRFKQFREETGPDNTRRKDSSKELVGRPDSAGVKDPKSVLARNGSIKTKIIDEEKKLAGVVKSVVKKKKEEKESGPNPLVDFEPKLNHKYDNET